MSFSFPGSWLIVAMGGASLLGCAVGGDVSDEAIRAAALYYDGEGGTHVAGGPVPAQPTLPAGPRPAPSMGPAGGGAPGVQPQPSTSATQPSPSPSGPRPVVQPPIDMPGAAGGSFGMGGAPSAPEPAVTPEPAMPEPDAMAEPEPVSPQPEPAAEPSPEPGVEPGAEPTVEPTTEPEPVPEPDPGSCTELAPNTSSGDLGPEEKCFIVTGTINGWQVSNIEQGSRTIHVNGVLTAPNAALPAPVDGGYTFVFSAGSPDYVAWSYW